MHPHDFTVNLATHQPGSLDETLQKSLDVLVLIDRGTATSCASWHDEDKQIM